MAKHITERLQQYIKHVAAGMGGRQAAKLVGYTASYSKVIATRCRKNPEVAAAIEEIRKKGCEMAAFGLVEAMKEADDAATFARLHKNPMAVVKACELRAKLSGLLIDRLELVPPVDLKDALDQATRRVFDVTPQPYQLRVEQAPAASHAVPDAGYYNGPGERGNPFGTD